MEKVRVALAALQKHLFWVLCSLSLIICLAVWYMATGSLAAQFTTKSNALEGKFKQTQSVAQKSNHPNEEGIKKIQERHVALGSNVFEAWRHLFDEQRARNKLPDVLAQREGFQEQFDKLWGPLEKLPETAKISPDHAEAYSNHIKRHFPRLFKEMGLRDKTDELESGRFPGMGHGPMGPGFNRQNPQAKAKTDAKDDEGFIDIDPAYRKKIVEDRFTWRNIPSTLEILMAQEDLWVYEALLRVIQNTNDVSKEPGKYQAPVSHKMANVKRIMAMDIGRDAMLSWQRAEQSVARLPSGGAAGVPAGPTSPGMSSGPMGPAPTAVPGPGMSSGPMGPAPGPHGGAGGANQGVSPLAGRYVDDQGKQLADPTQQPYAEFRMMPITLRLVIEQKAIPKLLAEFDRCSMPIDVRSVRILLKEVPPLEQADSSLVSPAAGPAPAIGPGPLPGPIGPAPGILPPGGVGHGPPIRPGGAEGADTSVAPVEEDSFDPMQPPIPIEIQGVIYIYNPPKMEELGKGTQGGAVAGPGAAPGAPAPGGPAPGTAPIPGPAPGTPPIAPPAVGPPVIGPPVIGPPVVAPPATGPAAKPAPAVPGVAGPAAPATPPATPAKGGQP